MPAQLNIFLLLFGGIQGLLLSLFLARKRTYRTGYVFLILYILVMLLQILMKVVSKIWLMENLSLLYWTSYRLPYLYGPLAHLLVLYSLHPGKKFPARHLLHFTPFVVAMMVMFDFAQYGRLNFFTDLFLDPIKNLVLQLITILGYHIAAYREWISHQRTGREVILDLKKTRFGWLKSFVIFSFVVSVLIALAVYYMYIYFPQWSDLRYLFVVLTIFIYWISYCALIQPSVFTLSNEQPPRETVVTTFLPKLVIHRPAKKYSNSGLSTGEIDAICSGLQRIMAEEKLYLNPDLTINDLAASVKCKRHHLSQVLNDTFHRSFYDYINQYRVDEARQMLLDPAKGDLKIASIAYDSGFNSLSTFNDVFKKLAGVTPSQFRKDMEMAPKQQRG